ncbi:hypothetical protein NDU88_005701 [Pleurodeles waltl]|uniref:Uncharacterized protein n=1 Tax=Pleurodeles waltl TaxID=8319 RepID=A0AAV7TCQ2_PLEWA|nr:hypothetical protein NDU88_005701 [Pleurodeles waltl]
MMPTAQMESIPVPDGSRSGRSLSPSSPMLRPYDLSVLVFTAPRPLKGSTCLSPRCLSDILPMQTDEGETVEESDSQVSERLTLNKFFLCL